VLEPASAARISVSNTGQLENEMKNARSGDTVILQNGIYKPNGTLFIRNNGITVRAQNKHKALVENADKTDGHGNNVIEISGDGVVL
jgi:hypothetical protein